jgi:hypothetical protein
MRYARSLDQECKLPDGQRGIDILIRNGNISAIGPAIYADGIPKLMRREIWFVPRSLMRIFTWMRY